MNPDDYLNELTPEQQRNWQERQFMLKFRVKPEARPHLCYSVICKTCHKEHIVRSIRRATLSEQAINILLILDGWEFGPAGYECPACQHAWAEGVVAYLKGMEQKPKEVESTASPLLTKQQVFEQIGQIIEHISVEYHPETQTLKLAVVDVSPPISGQFQLDSQTGINVAGDWLESAREIFHDRQNKNAAKESRGA